MYTDVLAQTGAHKLAREGGGQESDDEAVTKMLAGVKSFSALLTQKGQKKFDAEIAPTLGKALPIESTSRAPTTVASRVQRHLETEDAAHEAELWGCTDPSPSPTASLWMKHSPLNAGGAGSPTGKLEVSSQAMADSTPRLPANRTV